jgi:sugar phosphate isomerase/epimerase
VLDPGPIHAFSTLACPEWSAAEIVERGAAFGYDAIEWRGGPDGHVRTDWPAQERARLRRLLADHGIGSLAVTSYTDFVTGDERARIDSVDHLRRHLDLAADLGAPTVRAFVGIVDDGAPTADLLGRAIDGLAACLDSALQAGVAIAVEPHDDFARATSIAPILARLDPATVGAVWDIVNAWGVGEDPADGLAAIRGRIRYVQVKDARWSDGAWQLTPIGEGDVPLAGALRALAQDGPLPPLSVEWERAWHPGLDPADVALPRALTAVRDLVAGTTQTVPDPDASLPGVTGLGHVDARDVVE